MSPLLRRTLAAALACALLAACGGSSSDDDQPAAAADPAAETEAASEPAELSPLRITVYPGNNGNLIEFVGVELGIFEKHGLDVDLIELAGGPDHMNAVLSNSADLASNSPFNFLLANAAGQELLGVVPTIGRPAYSWIGSSDWDAAGADADYPDNVATFKGARIGIPVAGGEIHLLTQRFLQDAGLSDSDVSYVPVGGPQTALAALGAGQIDVLVAYEPMQTLAEAQFGTEMLLDLRTGDGPTDLREAPGHMRGTTKAKLDEDPDRFRHYQDAVVEIIEIIQDPAREDEVLDAFSQYADLDRALLATMLENNRDVWSTAYSCEGHASIVEFQIEHELNTPDKALDCEAMWWEQAEKFVG